MRKPRPAVVVSPDEMNNRLNTVLVAPLTKRGFVAPFRVPCQFAGISGQVALDHIRSVDKRRLERQLGQLDPAAAKIVLATLRELFEE
jgi:mRNA interferase MazF